MALSLKYRDKLPEWITNDPQADAATVLAKYKNDAGVAHQEAWDAACHFPHKSKAKAKLHLQEVARLLEREHTAQRQRKAEEFRQNCELRESRIKEAMELLEKAVSFADGTTEREQNELIKMLLPVLKGDSMDVVDVLRTAVKEGRTDFGEVLNLAVETADSEATEAYGKGDYGLMNRWNADAHHVAEWSKELNHYGGWYGK